MCTRGLVALLERNTHNPTSLAIISVLIIVIFKLTISSVIKNYEKKIYENFNKEKVEYFKDKLILEMKNAIKKDEYFKKDDAILIKKFLEKIKKEIN